VMIRLTLPFHLRTLAHVGSEVMLEVVVLQPRPGHAPLGTGRAPLTENAARYPMFSAGFLLLVTFGLLMMLGRCSKFAT